MALPVRDQLKYWGIAAVVFLVVLWSLGNILLPFVVGGAVAYFLDPVADRLQRLGLGRAAATGLIGLVVLVVVAVAFLLVVPALIRQGVALAESAPDMLRQLHTFLTGRFPDLIEPDSQLRQTLAGLGDMLRARGLELVNGLLSSALGVVNFIVFLLIVPVVSFYLLLDWDRMVAHVDALLPRDHAPTIRQLAAEVDRVLAGFVRGQMTVCLILAAYYATALGIVGLQFGLVVGVTAGLISFIPYLGAIIGGALSIGLALFQFWGDWGPIGAVVAIFVIGQILEGNILVPRMVGSSVGLHPVWLLFALSVFGALFGFVGLLVAVPVAAAIGVLARFGVRQYAGSLLYRGVSGRDDGAP
ncbi:MAG: AI-2E family transporter [Gemmobacter sp.]